MKNLLKTTQTALTRASVLSLAFVLVGSVFVVATPGKAAAAACESLGVDHGYVNSTVNIPETAEYRVWSRLKTSNSEYNTYFLEIDGNQCFWVGGPMTANQWVWIGTKDNNASSKLTVNLSKGAHTIKVIGNDEGLLFDRLIFTSDMNCVPTGNGSNCDVPSDTSPPKVELETPAANSTVSGTVNVTASASDNNGIKKVDFYLNSTLMSSDTSAPYGFSLKTTDFPDGEHLLIAKAYDSANNVASDSYRIKIQNANIQLPSPPSDVQVSAPSYNSVTITWKLSPGASGYQIFRDGVPIAQVGANVTSYTDTGLLPNTDYDYRVAAIHESGAASDPSQEVSTKTHTVDDSDAPSEVLNLKATAVSSAQINLSWEASVDNIGVKYYDIYRGKGSETPQKIAQITTTSFGDVGLSPATEYSYYVRARDANNNTGEQSDTVKAKTNTAEKRSVIYGTIRGQDTAGKGIPAATSILTKQDGTRVIYTATARGSYIYRGLEAGTYGITYSGPANTSKYNSLSISVKVADEIVRKNVTLEKR